MPIDRVNTNDNQDGTSDRSHEKDPNPNGPTFSFREITSADFDGLDFEDPIRDSRIVSCEAMNTAYWGTLGSSRENNQNSARAFALLAAVTSLYFTPNDKQEPFKPMLQMWQGRRSAIPEDFRGSPIDSLRSIQERIQNPGLKARIADVSWILDRSRAADAQTAISCYVQSIEAVRNGELRFSDSHESVFDSRCRNYLGRALVIGRQSGWDKAAVGRAKTLLIELRIEAYRQQKLMPFLQLGFLDYQFGITEPENLANESKTLAESNADTGDHLRLHELWKFAGQCFASAKQDSEANYAKCEAAECLVQNSLSQSNVALFRSHWLEQAIDELQKVPGTEDRRRELREDLGEVQRQIPEQLQTISHEVNLHELVEQARNHIERGSPIEALGALASLGNSPNPEDLEQQATKSIRDAPLSSMFGTTIFDADGKPKHKVDALGTEGSDQATIKQQVAHHEALRRRIHIAGLVEPARLAILERHHIGYSDIEIITANSPFVPDGHTSVFTEGLYRFLIGDAVGAVHILVPQLENAIRKIIRELGSNVTKLNRDMTQEDRSLSALMESERSTIEEVFGSEIVSELDHVFLYRGGPSLRHTVAHGLVSDSVAMNSDSQYACWLIYRLCCLPLLNDWEIVVQHWKSINDWHDNVDQD